MSVAGRALTGLFGVLGIPLAWLLVQKGFAAGWVAVVLLVLYEVVILLGAIVASVAQQVVRRRIEQVMDVVDLAFGRRVSRYARYYRRYVLERDGHINARDLAHTPSHIPELDAVYVDVGLAPGSPSGRAGGLLPTSQVDQAKRQSIHEFLDQKRPAVCVVIGAPGSGKSTLLRHTARLAVSQGRERRRHIPVMLALRDHAHILNNGSLDAVRTLADFIRGDIGPLAVAEPAGWWESQLLNGNCLILLDGLDEVARNEHRATVAAWIENQIAKYPKNDFVITSRPHGYQTAVIPKAAVLQVRPFTADQISQFVHGWCRAAERLATNTSGPEIDQRAREDAEELIGQLSSAPALRELAVNPLLLTMMVLVHRERRSLPAGRADLYSQVCDVMLWRRLESKKLEVKPPGAVRQRILAALAYDMMAAETRDYRKIQVVEVFDRALQQIDADISAEDLLTALVETSGLLVEREKDLYAFAHHTIGEYLAATHIRNKNLSTTLIRSVGDPWWHETTLLYVTDADANEIVEACLERNSGASLALAFDCVRSHGQLDRQLRARLDRIRQDAFLKDATPEQRELIARALASSHLSKLVTAANGVTACALPIPEDLYWLFCKDTGVPLPDGTDPYGPPQERPAAGMRRSDADAFVTWINRVSVQDLAAFYRLPTATEVKFVMNRQSLRDLAFPRYASVWTSMPVHDEDHGPWAPDSSNPHGVLGAGILDAAHNDLFHTTIMLDGVLDGARLDAHALSQIFEHALTAEHDRAYDHQMNAVIRIANDLSRNIEVALVLADDPARKFELPQGLDIDLLRGHARSLRSAESSPADLKFYRDLTLRLGHALTPASTFDPEIVFSQPTNRLEGFSYISTRITSRESLIGKAITWALAHVELSGPTAGSVRGNTIMSGSSTRWLFEASGISETHVEQVKLDSLMNTVVAACTAVGGQDVRQRKHSWAAATAWRLVDSAEMVLSRSRRPTPKVLANVRVPALLLAVEAEMEGNSSVASSFRSIAAGVTLLDHRFRGKAPLETILLVRE
jgi:hypothetical protein